MMNTFYRARTVLIDIHKTVRYTDTSEDLISVRYENVIGFEVVSDPAKAAEIEAATDGSCIDDYHEYLVLHFADGDLATFRNSYVDMFLV